MDCETAATQAETTVQYAKENQKLMPAFLRIYKFLRNL